MNADDAPGKLGALGNDLMENVHLKRDVLLQVRASVYSNFADISGTGNQTQKPRQLRVTLRHQLRVQARSDLYPWLAVSQL